MATIALDTYEAVQEMKAVGFTDDQAATVSRMIRRAQDIDLSNLATKADLAVASANTDNRIYGLETKIEPQKSDILKWVIGAIGLQTMAILGTVIILLKMFVKT